MRVTRLSGLGPILKLTVVAALLTVSTRADAGETFVATVTVNVGDNWFCSPSFSGDVCPTSIKIGDTITWSWVGSNPHTSTACSDASFTNCGAAQGWDSGIKTSGTFSRTFTNAGSFFYRCDIHPGIMRGRIDVIQDTDGDGWSDAVETAIGTDPLDACPDNTADNAWPADLNNDTFSDGTDITILATSFNKAVPPAPPRHNIAPVSGPDGFVDGTDITVLATFFNKGCGPGEPGGPASG